MLFIIAIWLLVQFTPFQNFLARQVTKKLAKELKTDVSLKHVDFLLFNKMVIEGLMIKDRNKDTLAYVGKAGVNITDWFFLKNDIVLHYVSLDQTKLFLHRSDSIWNYQFIIDYFTPPPTSDTTKKGIKLDFKKADIKDLLIFQKDEWNGQNMQASIGSLSVEMDQFDLIKKNIQVKTLNLKSPFFSISDYTGKIPVKVKSNKEDIHLSDDVEKWNLNGWDVSVTDATIENGEFKNDLKTERDPFPYFDGAHIDFKKINGTIFKLHLAGDSLKAKINLAAEERSGFKIKNLDADFVFTPQFMEFSNLDIQTNNSRFGDYLVLRFKNFNHDMSRFITHVMLEGNFKKSKIYSDDIAYFVPQLKNRNNVITIQGLIKGTVDHIKGKDVVITTLQKTLFDGNFTMDGLPDIESTFLDIKANRLETSYADAAILFPDIKKISSPNLRSINYLSFKGNYTGYIKDFVTYGTIQTNLGTLVTDLNLKLPKGSDPIYSGKIKTTGFALGTFLNDPVFGKIVLDGSIKGRGFNPKTLFAEIDTKINSFEINKYTYTNIDAKGIYEKRIFDGALVVNDSNLNIDVNGLMNFNKDTPVYKLTGNVYKLNFKELKLSQNELSLNGYIDLNFKGKTIDDFLGTAIIQNATLTNKGEPLSFNYLSLSSTILNGQKELIAKSNEADVTVTGNFNILDLPSATLSFLNNYFPAYIAAPKNRIKNQDFSFTVHTKNISPFIDIWKIPVNGFDNSTIKGRISTTDNQFNFETDVPFFQYNKITFNNTRITGIGSNEKLTLTGKLDEIKFSDSLSLPQTDFTVVASKDTGYINIKTSASQTLKNADLSARIHTTREGIGILFQPSTFVINDKIWTIAENGELFLGKKKIIAENLKITSGTEELSVYSKPSEIGNYEDLVVEMRKFRIDDYMPYLLKDPRLEGVVTGRIDIINPFGKMLLETNLSVEKFRFNNDSIGIIKIIANYNPQTGDINTNIVSDNIFNEFSGGGSINIKDPANTLIDQVYEVKSMQLNLLQKYLAVIMKDMKGIASGVIQLKGNANKPDIIGKVKVNNASFILDFTKCKYLINEGTEIEFKQGAIDFGSIVLKDTTNRSATFSGILYHQFFKKMSFDMNFKSNDDKQGILILNTTKNDNKLFYGYATGRVSGSVRGRSDNIILKLNGTPTDSSMISLPTSDTRVTGTADFIVFRKYGEEMKIESVVKESSNLLVDLDLYANPLLKINLILDEITNDVIQGQGDGFINLIVGTNESTSMNGWFNITKGKYTYNWQAFIKKPFEINKGRIEWSGNPYDARINIDASYIVRNISLPPELSSDCTNERNNIIIIGNLSNTLSNPVINFKIELPQGHPCRNNPITISRLNQLYSNTDELNRQVVSLMFFNQFLSTSNNQSNLGTSIGTNVFNTAAGTFSEFIAQQVSSGLGQILNSIPGFSKLKLDPYITFTPGLISGTQAQNLGFQGTGTFGVTQRLLNGKLILKAGGSVLVNSSQGTASTNNNGLSPDITLEWLITPDGKLRLIGFYRSIYDLQWRTSNRTGISFSYVRDFN